MSNQDLKRIFKARSVIFHEGEKGDAAYLIRQGTVSIVKKTDQGYVTLATISKNALFGEMALIDGSKRMAAAIAADDVICSVISPEMLSQKLAAIPAAARAVFELMLRYCRETLPWDQRQKSPLLAAESDFDERVRPAVPPPGAPIPLEFSDPFLGALYKVVIDYVRRRLPPRAA